jgi:curved DNA-binding protein CbpA
MSIDPYEMLGVKRSATEQEIKEAYRKMAAIMHPDKHKSKDRDAATEAFKGLQSAYDLLMDPLKRRIFDDTGDAQEAQDSVSGVIKSIQTMWMEAFDRDPAGNVLAALYTMLRDSDIKLRQQLIEASKMTAIVETALVRLRMVKSGTRSDFLHDALDRRIHQLNAQMAEHRDDLATIKIMYDLLQPYRYDVLKFSSSVRELVDKLDERNVED